jgi:hypothetical protein
LLGCERSGVQFSPITLAFGELIFHFPQFSLGFFKVVLFRKEKNENMNIFASDYSLFKIGKKVNF